MAIRHSTLADSSFSTLGRTAWNADHDGDASDLSFVQSGTGAIARTAQGKMRDEVHVFDFIPSQDHAGILAGTDSNEHRSEVQAAIDQAYSGGIQEVKCAGSINIAKPLYLWGAAHYWQTDSGVALVGSGVNKTVIKKTTTTTVGDGSAYGSTDAIVLFTPHDKLVASSAFNCGLRNIRLESTASGSFGAVALGPLARLDIDRAVITGVATALNAQDTMYLSNIRRLHTLSTAYGIKMDTTGTTNHLDGCFVSGTATVGYLLRGVYSTASGLAADGNTGVVYQFANGDWVINGLGAESTSATKIIELLAGTANKVIVNNPYIQPQDNAAKTVFVVAAGSRLIVNGGSVGSDSSPQALAGQLASITAGVSVNPYEGLFLNNVAILDTYAVASTGAIMQSAGSTKFGAKTVATATPTAIYTALNEEVGLFIAYLSSNAGFRSVAYLGVAGGNEGFAVINSSGLTLTNSLGVISVEHAIGSDQTIRWKFLRFGDALPVTW